MSRLIRQGARQRLRLTRWDVSAFLRALLLAAVTLGLAWLITAVTDEGGVSWGERAGRTLPLAPVCAAIGAWGALAAARARGEVLALGALGRSRAQIAAASIAGGALVAVVAALLVGGLRSVDVAGFFPTATHPSLWQWDGEVFLNRPQALRVEADGTLLSFAAAHGSHETVSIPPYGRSAASLTTALAAIALPMLLADVFLGGGRGRGDRREISRGTRIAILASAIAVAASVLLFQAAALHRVPAILGPIPWAVLLAFALWRYRERE